MLNRNSNRVPYLCSFCSKGQADILRLIAGPGSVYICNECVDLSARILKQDFDGTEETTIGSDLQARCSFCGYKEEEVGQLAAGPNSVYICNSCVELCMEIIDEEINGPKPKAVQVDWTRRRKIVPTILEAAGLTPLVRLNRLNEGVQAEICVKVEYFGPSGSVKDRILPYIVAQAEKRGELKPGMALIEGTTGNTGIATSMTGAVRGYPVTIVMPDGMSDERKKVIRAYGAELVLTPGAESDVDLVIEKVAELKAARPGYYFEVGQFKNMDNSEAHYLTTGPEIWEQTEGQLDIFVASQGTGGTVSGVARYLKEQNPKIKVFAVEPAECDILAGGSWGAHRIEGIGDGFIPEVLDLNMLDGVVTTTSDESIEMAKELARKEGIFAGISCGCNIAAALKLARAYPEARRIVTIINDNGLRYFSTELCGEVNELEVPEREHPLDPEIKRRLDEKKLLVIR